MAEVVVFPDVEGAAALFLRTALKVHGWTVTVATRVPATMPANMVRVSRTGGTRRDLVTDRPQLTIECWAADSIKASELARLAQGLMHSAAGAEVAGVWVRSVEEVGGIQSLPDPDTNKPRYQFTVRWHVRGNAI